MTRSRVGLTLGLAVVVGVLIGLSVFRLAGPLPFATAGPSPSVSVPPASTPASITPTPSVSPSATPSPTPKATKTAKPARTTAPPTQVPAPTVSTEPPFTAAALLQPEEFLEFGWGKATVIQSWNDLPSEQVTDCTEITTEDGPIEAAHAAKYQGLSSTAGEMVVRFKTAAAARGAVQDLLSRIDECQPGGGEFAGLAAERMAAPAPDGISELYLWNTTGGTTVEGVVGLARDQDRVALLSLQSETTDPVQTTQVGALTLTAGRRLR